MLFLRTHSFASFPRSYLAILACVFIGSCSSHNANERSVTIHSQAIAKGWNSQIIQTPQFDFQVFVGQSFKSIQQKKGTKSESQSIDLLSIYIEGDGNAWVHGRYASDDPTPNIPVGLNLAMAQPSGVVAYLGRPCQYLGIENNPACTPSVWTNGRFSESVVISSNLALTQLKNQFNAKKIELIGYSGGAAIALLVSARRDDVLRIISVAGNLDPQAWTKKMHLEDLEGSLETSVVIPKIFPIPQLYFVGGKDKVVPPGLAEDFAKRYPPEYRPKIISVKDNNHICCWSEQWPSLWHRFIK